MEVISIPQIVNGNSLHQMFKLQKGLLSVYMIIEDMPQYPVDLNVKRNQILLRGFIDRIIRELSEAYEELGLAYKHLSSNEPKLGKARIMKYNEEIADTWHFMLNLLIYCDLDIDGLENILHDLANDEPELYGSLYEEDKTLRTLLKIASFANFKEGLHQPTGFTGFDESELTKYPEFLGGNTLSIPIVETHERFLWAITHTLQKTANNLKNKEWSRTQTEVNVLKFREDLFNSLLTFVQYMDYIKKNETSIFNSYCLKNQINQKRIKDGY